MLMQCASSTAMKDGFSRFSSSMKESETSRSGATYSSLSARQRIFSSASCCSAAVSELSSRAADTPHSIRPSTWSFISEISGETTTAIPGRATAGAWKHSDLPPPVGSTTSESCPATTADIASC